MKLTLWQQFSSNHSGSFHVVGAFATEAEAVLIADTLRVMLRRILAWYQEHNAISGNPESVTPVEQAIGAEYGIQWTEGIDWIGYSTSSETVEGAVKQYDRLVQIDNPDQTWNTRRVFIALLEHLGATATAGWDLEAIETTRDATWVVMTLSCSAPDSNTAIRLHETWMKQLRFGRIGRDGLHLQFENIPVDTKMTPDLLASLRDAQCKEIDCYFRAVDTGLITLNRD